MRRWLSLGFVLFFPAIAAAQGDSLVMLTGSETGAYHRFGLAIKKLLDSSGLKVRLQTSGGSADNIRRLANGEASLAIVQNDMAYAAARGQEPFPGDRIENVRALMGLFYEDLLVIARKDLKLESASGIGRRSRVVLGAEGSGTSANARLLLRTAGVEPDTMYRESRKALPLLAQDSVDVVFLTAALDSALLATIDSNRAELVSLGPDLIARMRAARPYYDTTTITAGARQISTLRIRAYLVARDTLASSQVRNVVRSIYQGLHSGGENPLSLPVDTASLAEVHGIRLHPSAARFYCSVGLQSCDNTLAVLMIIAVVLVALAFTAWGSAPARAWLLRHAPGLSRALFGPHGIAGRYRFVVVPVLAASVLVLGSLAINKAEVDYGLTYNIHTPFEDLGLNQSLLWMLVFTATGHEDEGVFPRSTTGKVTSALIGWASIASILLLLGLLSSDKVARRMKMRLQSHPDRLRDHVVVCGWNRRARAIIKELTSAELGARRQLVAVVCVRPEQFMEQQALDEDVVLHIAGEPTDLAQLERAGVDRAHTVLILADDEAGDTDARALLSLVTVDKRSLRLCREGSRAKPVRTVVEILDPQNMELFQEAHAEVVVCAADFNARLLSNSVLNPTVSSFLRNVLTIGIGDELIEVPVTGRERVEIVGQTFDEVLLTCRSGGLLLLAINPGGAPGAIPREAGTTAPSHTDTVPLRERLLVNPTDDQGKAYRVSPGDSLLFLAESERSLESVFGDARKWQAGFTG